MKILRRGIWFVEDLLTKPLTALGFGLPSAPWGFHTFNEANSLMDDPHAKELASLLKNRSPLRFHELYHGVLNSTFDAKRAQETLQALDMAYMVMSQRVVEARATLQAIRAERMSPKGFIEIVLLWLSQQKGRWNVTTIGLAFLVFLSTMELLQIEILDIRGEESLLVVCALIASLFLTAAEQQGIERLVMMFRRDEIRWLVNGNYKPIPFWLRLKHGDAPVTLSIILVITEVAYASVGLVQRLPVSLQTNPAWQFTVVSSCGLFAIVNLTLAWGEAYKKLHDEVEREQQSPYLNDSPLHDAYNMRHSYNLAIRKAVSDLATAQHALRRLANKRRQARRDAQKQWNRARWETFRFRRDVSRWVWLHADDC